MQQPDHDDRGLTTPSNPVDRAIAADLVSARLMASSDDGYYGLVSYDFPIVIAWISVGVERLTIRLDCSDYPHQAPYGCLWDPSTGLPLRTECWPVGGRSETVFRKDWSPSNKNAPYLACDRVALSTHPDWKDTLVGRAWNSERTVVDYLAQIHDALKGSQLPKTAASKS
jgi:hypothetical protein